MGGAEGMEKTLGELNEAVQELRAATPRPYIFDPEKCLVIIQTYPTGQAHTDIWATLQAKGIPLQNCHPINVRDTILARNIAVRDYALLEALPEVLLLDADMMPGPRTEKFWQSGADIVGASYDTGHPESWEGGSVHCGMMKVRLEVFQTLPPPWFLIDRSPDGCEVRACECMYFCRRAKAAGFRIEQAGWCGHAKPHGCSAPY